MGWAVQLEQKVLLEIWLSDNSQRNWRVGMGKKRKTPKGYDIERDIRNLIAAQGPEGKWRQQARRVQAYIFEAPRAEQVTRLDKVLLILQRLPTHRYLALEIAKGLASEAFKLNRLDLFLDVHILAEKTPQKSQDFSSVVRRTMLGAGPDAFSLEELQAEARALWLTAVYEVAGETLDDSIRFALFCIEQLGDVLQESKYSGLVDFHDPKAASVLKMMSSCARRVPNAVGSASRLWIDRLIDAVGTGMVVDQIMETFIKFLQWISPSGKIAMAVVKTGRENELALRDLVDRTSGRQNQDSRLYVTPAQFDKVNRWGAQIKLREEQLTSEAETLFDRFERQYEGVICPELDRMRTAIIEHTRQGLRPGGADHFDILLSALYRYGVRSVIFYPDGQDFPDLRIDVVVHKAVPSLFLYECAFRNLKLELQPGIFVEGRCPGIERMRRLLEFVIIDILHRIMVEGQELKPHRSQHASSAGSIIDLTPRTIAVRPHFHPLRPGHQATAQALINLRKAIGWRTLPPRATFVSAHYRGKAEGFVYDLPSEAIGAYRDRDLLDKGII